MKKENLYLLLLPLLLFASCNSDDGSTPAGDAAAVQFSSDIVHTKTTNGGGQWEPIDPIGIYMVKQWQTLSTTTIVESADNVQYKAQTGSNNSHFIPVENPIYYPQDGDKVDFVAYYPYKTSFVDYKYPIDVSDQSDPSKIDLLYSKNATGKDKNSGTVDMQFAHVLSKVSFTLTAGEGAPDLLGAKIEISNLKRAADFNLADGTLSNLGSQGVITPNAATGSAIVVPQTTSSSKLTVTLADNVSKFNWDFPANTEFKAGKNHTYVIMIDRTGIIITTGSITDWVTTEVISYINYKVGDYYPDPRVNINNSTEKAKIKGVVFWVDPQDSKHGKIVGLDEAQNLQWAKDNYTSKTNATSKDNGMVNMREIYNISTIFSNYPAFSWVHEKNYSTETYRKAEVKGVWYLPAVNELKSLYDSVTPVNISLSFAGGTSLSKGLYWSSSEVTDGAGVNGTHCFSFDKGIISNNRKNNTFNRTRSILAF